MNKIPQDRKKLKIHERVVLVNKRTGKISSSNDWLGIMVAQSVLNKDTSGIMQGLPLEKGRKLLISNRLEKKVKRSKYTIPARETTRNQALKILPHLAALFQRELPNYRSPRIAEFCRWIVKKLQDRASEANEYCINNGFDEVIDAQRSARWWQEQIKKMQS